MKYLGIWAGLLMGLSAWLLPPPAAAQSLVVVSAMPGAASAGPAANGPDFDGDGAADYFSIGEVGVDGKRCLQVGLSRGLGHWSNREAFCDVWSVATQAAPERGDIPGRQRWVARLTSRLDIPDLGRLPHTRDAVLLSINGRSGVLFFDGRRYVLHYGIDLQRVIHLEALEAFRRFEKTS